MSAFDPLDTERISAAIRQFMEQETGGPVSLGPLNRFTVGFSWVTYGFDGQWVEKGEKISRKLILRVGPPSGLFAPYKASVEFLTLKSLTDVAIETPAAHWYTDDPELLGAPFYICDQAPGEAPVPWHVDFTNDQRDQLGQQFIDGLAALHNFDWRQSPVGFLGNSRDIRNAARTEVAYWEAMTGQWTDGKSPILAWAASWFRQNAPDHQRLSLIHGDYRIGNFLSVENRITAILDWELVHIGDPLEDLGWVCMRAWRGRSDKMCHMMARNELMARYQEKTGLHVDEKTLNYWEAFGAYKLAVIHLGAAHCFEHRGFNDLRMAGMGAQTARVLVEMEKAMERVA